MAQKKAHSNNRFQCKVCVNVRKCTSFYIFFGRYVQNAIEHALEVKLVTP